MLAIPTESSYGLAAHPGIAAGVEAVYRIKARDRGKPLPVVVADLAQLADLGVDLALPLVARLAEVWPAPLTAVLPIAGPLPAAAGTGSLAVRIPGHERLRALLAALGTGLTATSANRSGGEPILEPAEAAGLLAGGDAMVIDDGVMPGGPPSTIVDLDPEAGRLRVLRPGSFPVERLPDRLAGRTSAR